MMQSDNTDAGQKNKPSNEKTFWDDFYASADIGAGFVVSSPRYIDFLTGGMFLESLGDIKGKKVLSIGGGVDLIALFLATKGAIVISLDISDTACNKTRELARKMGIERHIGILRQNFEEMNYCNEFDIVVSIKALHHSDIRKATGKIHAALAQNGAFVAIEPLCLANSIRFIHHIFRFHPYYPVTEEDKELGGHELRFIKEAFTKTEYYYFDFLTRPMFIYFFENLMLKKLIPPIKKIDNLLLRHLPLLKPLSSEILIKAIK
jgi:SAM-dependent methyltransferase